MRKNILLKALLGLAFGFLVSCDNTTDDPINQNKTTNPNNNSGGTTITGPRILSKTTSGGATSEEFVSTAGILEKGIFIDSSTPNSFFTGTPTYTTGNKISKVKFVGTANASASYNFDITYDANGRISGTTCEFITGTVITTKSDFFYTYDSAGKITKIMEKKKMGIASPNYSHFTENTLTYSGDNIAKVVSVMGVMDNNGNPQAGASATSTFDYTNYDSKINPYTTLPKAFFLMYSLINPASFYMISSNNVGKMSFAYPGPVPAVSIDMTYKYDTQNYPVSDQSQNIKYIYKAL